MNEPLNMSKLPNLDRSDWKLIRVALLNHVVTLTAQIDGNRTRVCRVSAETLSDWKADAQRCSAIAEQLWEASRDRPFRQGDKIVHKGNVGVVLYQGGQGLVYTHGADEWWVEFEQTREWLKADQMTHLVGF